MSGAGLVLGAPRAQPKTARDIALVEVKLMQRCVAEPGLLPVHDEAALRWALSLARISSVVVTPAEGTTDTIDIGPATHQYRARLWQLLEPVFDGDKFNRDVLLAALPAITALCRDERESLLLLFGNRMPYRALDRATRKRPLALALGGGGGTAFVFVGAMAVLDEAGITPSAIAGTSMGAILGAFRARKKGLDLPSIRALLARLSWRKVFRFFETESRFGLPATMKLYLREVIGQEFEREDGEGFLRLCDLEIPLRVSIAGLVEGRKERERELIERYAHLLDGVVSPRQLRHKAVAIARALSEFAQQPVRPIYVGGTPETASFDVLDAIGFSSSVPGVIHYDILRDDPRMQALVAALLKREGVFRLVDGGLTDNLPAEEAFFAVQSGSSPDRDPFVLALDGFAPRFSSRNMLFLPLMRIAQETSKKGRDNAHMTLDFDRVLSPLTVVPTPAEFMTAMENGRAETEPHVALIRKLVGPIPDPPAVFQPR